MSKTVTGTGDKYLPQLKNAYKLCQTYTLIFFSHCDVKLRFFLSQIKVNPTDFSLNHRQQYVHAQDFFGKHHFVSYLISFEKNFVEIRLERQKSEAFSSQGTVVGKTLQKTCK